MSDDPSTEGKGLHHRIWPYMDHLVQYATDRLDDQGPWIVRDRSAALRAERKGEGPAMVRTWVPGPWSYVTPQEQGQAWSTDLPGWQCIPDPEYPGERVWYHMAHRGEADVALARVDDGSEPYVVLKDPVFEADEVAGEEIGAFSDLDAALAFALKHLKGDAK